MIEAFHQRVGHVDQLAREKEAKKPAPARIEVILEALIPCKIAREEQSAPDIDEEGVGENEEIEGECPFRRLRQLKFEPPPEDRTQENGRDPEEVHPVRLFPPR